MNEDAYVSDEEELECPLCMEEFDISDRTFKPCPCGYQICRFCYNRIVNSETANGCPACRRQYTEETVEFKPLSAEEWKRDQQRIHSRKLKEKEKRESEMASRRHLSNMRVVQKNLVYVIGFSPKSADADLAATLRGNDYFAQYGKINKIVVNKKSHPNGQPTVGVYITYARKEDAARAVQAVDNTINDGRILRASFGTTKYCSAYLRQQVCQNPNCMYLHEPGEDLDSYTREDMSTIQHAAKAAEGMHANALAAHHMRRQPSRADSTSTANQDDNATNGAALPPTASWASSIKPAEIPTAPSGLHEINENSESAAGKKPDSLPPFSRENKINQGEIPPPPSQAAQGSVHPSELLPPPVQHGLSHPILGEQDIESAKSFPQLFSWNPEPKRPSSPGKSKAHARSGSRYAFAIDSKTPPPGFIPPGLATGIQPPGFSAGVQTQVKDGTADFFSQFLQNANSTDSTTSFGRAAFEDPAIVGLSRDAVKSPTSQTAQKSNGSDRAETLQRQGRTDMSLPSRTIAATSGLSPSTAAPKINYLEAGSTKIPLSRSTSFSPAPGLQSPEIERPQSKFGASFAKLENLEMQAQEITFKTDAKARGGWEPTVRSKDLDTKSRMLPPAQVSRGHLSTENTSSQLTVPKSSGTWQPSPPPPRIPMSPSPKPIIGNVSNNPQKLAQSLKGTSKVPWEPSPPPSMSRTNSPLKPFPGSSSLNRSGTGHTAAVEEPSSSLIPSNSMSERPLIALPMDDFPTLPAPSAKKDTEPAVHSPVKKGWDTVPPVTAVPIISRPQSKAPIRRDSAQSQSSSVQDQARSRQNSAAEHPIARLQTPTRGSTPASSPVNSRPASPVPLVTPSLNRTASSLSAAPAISSPLANLNTGKQLRIVSNKANEETKLKTDKLLAEERAIRKIKEDEAAAVLKSAVRKSVPANSVKKTKEQRAAEQREKAEKREKESVVSSQPEDTPAPILEVAPIIGRARKQKNKQAPSKTTPSKTPGKSTSTDLEADVPDAEPEIEPEESSIDNRVAAADAITQISKEIDLGTYKFFQQIPGLNYKYEFSAEELSTGAELAHWPPYTGKETVEQLEKMLTQARKEANDLFKNLEKLQKRNTRFARVDVISV